MAKDLNKYFLSPFTVEEIINKLERWRTSGQMTKRNAN